MCNCGCLKLCFLLDKRLKWKHFWKLKHGKYRGTSPNFIYCNGHSIWNLMVIKTIRVSQIECILIWTGVPTVKGYPTLFM